MRLVAPESILRTAGAAWTDPETEAVFEWVLTWKLTPTVRFVGSRFGAADPENIVGSSILAAYRYRHSYDPARHSYYDAAKPDAGARAFSNWLRVIVMKTATRDARKARAAAERQALPPPLPPHPRPQWTDVVSLLPELEHLKAHHREALELVVRDGLSHAEAATRSGFQPCSANAMKVRYCRAVQELRHLVGDERRVPQGRGR